MKNKTIIFGALFLSQSIEAIEILEYENKLLHADYVCAINAIPLDNEVLGYQYSNNTLICNYKDLSSKTIENINVSRYHNQVENDNSINIFIVKDDPLRNYNDYNKELLNFNSALNNATGKNINLNIIGVATSDFEYDFNDSIIKESTDPNFSHNVFKNSFYYKYNSIINADYYLFLINDLNGSILNKTKGVADDLEVSVSNGLAPRGVVISNYYGYDHEIDDFLYTHEFGHLLGLKHDNIITNAKNRTSDNNIKCEFNNYLDLYIPYGKAKYIQNGVTAMGYDNVQVLYSPTEESVPKRLNEYSKSDYSFTKILSTNNYQKEILGCKEIGLGFFDEIKITRTPGFLAEADSAKALEISLPMLLNRNYINYVNPLLLNTNHLTNDNIYIKDIISETINNFGNDNYFISTGKLNNSFHFDFIKDDNTVHIPYLQGTNDKTLDIDISNFDFNDNLIISNGYNSLRKDITPTISNNYITGFSLSYFNNDNSTALSLKVKFRSGIEQESNKIDLLFNSINNDVFDNHAEAFYNADSTGIGMIKDFKKIIISMDNVFKGTESNDNHNDIGGTNQSDDIYGLGGNDILGDKNQNNSDWWLGNTNLTNKDFFGDAFYGGLDNDTIYGTRHGDYYYYNAGDGQDIIYEKSDLTLDSDSSWNSYTKDVLILENVYESDFDIVRSGYDIIIDFKYTDDKITIVNGLKQEKHQNNFYNLNAIEEISFEDGHYNLNQIIEKALVLKGTDGNDYLTGLDEYENIFESSFGSDTIIGSKNKDEYIITEKIKNLTINDLGGIDTLIFGNNKENVIFEKDSNDLKIIYKNGTAIIIVQNHFSFNPVDIIEFGNATLDIQDIQEKTIQDSPQEPIISIPDDAIYSTIGTDNNDLLYGERGNIRKKEFIYGRGGNDYIYGKHKNASQGGQRWALDVIVGGRGNDTIEMSQSIHHIYYYLGDGDDIIKLFDGFPPGERHLLILGEQITEDMVDFVSYNDNLLMQIAKDKSYSGTILFENWNLISSDSKPIIKLNNGTIIK